MKKCYLRYKIVCFIIVRVVFFIGNKIKNECKLFLIIFWGIGLWFFCFVIYI